MLVIQTRWLNVNQLDELKQHLTDELYKIMKILCTCTDKFMVFMYQQHGDTAHAALTFDNNASCLIEIFDRDKHIDKDWRYLPQKKTSEHYSIKSVLPTTIVANKLYNNAYEQDSSRQK